MTDVNVDIYKANQINPLANLSSVYGIMNAAQTNQLLQTANKQRQFDLNKAQTDSIIGTLGPLAARGDVNKATALGTVANVVKSLGIPPQIAGTMLQPLMNAPDDPKAIQPILGNMYAIMSGSGAGAPVSGAVQPGSLAPTTTPVAARVTQGTVPVTAGPSATAAATTSGGAAGTQLGEAGASEIDYKNQVNPLEQAIPALQRLGKTGVGPGSEEINQIKSLAVSFGFAPDKWTGTVKDYDEAHKYLVQQARTFGNTGTNDQLAASFSGNPNMKMSQAASVDVAKTMLALRRMQYMRLQSFRTTGQPPESYPAYAATYNTAHDPRAFGFDHMSVVQRKQVIQSLPPAKRAQFMMDVDAADKSGILTNQ